MDSFFEELRTYVCSKLKAISGMEYPTSRKEDNDGAEFCQAIKG